MPSTPRPALLAPTLFLAMAVIGYLIMRGLDSPQAQETRRTGDLPPRKQPSLSSTENKPAIRSNRSLNRAPLPDDTPSPALKNECIARFDNDADYYQFLSVIYDRKFKLLGKSDTLRAVRFSYSTGSNFSDLDNATLGFNYLVTIPSPPTAKAQAEAVGFGRSALAWLGVTGDNSAWGKNITVAVLDSGVNKHRALSNGTISQLTLTELATGDKQLGHGTAVASIISGDHPLALGVAPASDILSIRITDAGGTSNSFTLAKGILLAADSGAEIINISMGSYGDSKLVADAVRYAQEKGAVIVASSGNGGLDAIAYPAAYEGVIAVGAVEGNGEHLDFSNSGSALSITAPGYQINAAWGDNQLTSFSGTSASAPFISGAIAAAMSENPHMSAQEAANQILSLANDAGMPGSDPHYGNGILALDRVMEHGTPGIYDAAVVSQTLAPPTDSTSLPRVLVTIQNQGTETLINSPVQM